MRLKYLLSKDTVGRQMSTRDQLGAVSGQNQTRRNVNSNINLVDIKNKISTERGKTFQKYIICIAKISAKNSKARLCKTVP
jgi:hypothetical protein